MPFKLTGYFAGKTYNETAISIQELKAELGIDLKDKKYLQFERVEGVKKDQYGRVTSQPAARRELRRFNFLWKGASCHLIWYQTEAGRDARTNAIKYVPTHHTWGTKTLTTVDVTDAAEEAFFMHIHPFNSASPLYQKGKHKVVFRTVDREKEADQFLLERAELAKIENEILNGDITILKRNLKSRGGYPVENMREKEIRGAWFKLFENAKAQKKTKQFVEEFNNAATVVGGYVQDAIDKNILSLTSDARNSNIKYWNWGDSASKDLQGVRILKVTADSVIDARAQLVNYINDRVETLGEQLRKQVEGSSASSQEKLQAFVKGINKGAAQTQEEPLSPNKEKYKMAYESQILAFIPSKKAICWINDGLAGEVIMEVKEADAYLDEFDKFLNTKNGKAVAQAIEQKLADLYKNK